MKAIESSLINQSALVTSNNPEEACPTCGCAAWCFENGLVFCIDHGYFEPEPTDQRLYAMALCFNERHGLVFPVTDHGQAAPAADDDSFLSRHRPVPQCLVAPQVLPATLCAASEHGSRAASVTAVTISLERVDGDIQGAYEHGSRALA